MATYYVDPAAAGANDGTSWTDAWTDLDSALAAPVAAADIVYCRGKQSLTTAGGPRTATVSGTAADKINFIGCDAAGTARAGQFTLEGSAGDLPASCLDLVAINFLRFEYFTFDSASGPAVDATDNSDDLDFFHCAFLNAGSDGFGGGAINTSRVRCLHCVFGSNTTDGYDNAFFDTVFERCNFYGNGTYGIQCSNSASTTVWVSNSLFRENGDDHIWIRTGYYYFINGNTFDASTAGSGIKVENAAYYVNIYWNRFTNNNQYGIEVVAAADGRDYEDWNGFNGNGVGERLNITAGPNDVTLTADGYIDAAADNYTLSDTAEQRRVANDLDWA